MTSDKHIALLHENKWLASLPAPARQELIKVCKVRVFNKNEKVHIKGDVTDALYGVLQGEVRISASTYTGDEIILTRILSGQWFGEIAILDGGRRTHDAYTACDSELIVLPKNAVIELCKKMPEIYQALVQLLCEHCRKAFNAMDELLAYTPEQRLARRLLQRVKEIDNLHVDVPQQEMGAWVGISRQSANKILKSWQEKGWIKRVYRGLVITDKRALQNISE